MHNKRMMQRWCLNDSFPEKETFKFKNDKKFKRNIFNTYRGNSSVYEKNESLDPGILQLQPSHIFYNRLRQKKGRYYSQDNIRKTQYT